MMAKFLSIITGNAFYDWKEAIERAVCTIFLSSSFYLAYAFVLARCYAKISHHDWNEEAQYDLDKK